MRLTDYELDAEAIDEGVPHRDPWEGTATFYIRSTSSRVYKRAAAEGYAKLADADEKNPDDNARANAALLEADATGLLARWEGVELDDGTVHNGYDREVALRLMRIPSFRKWVRSIAEREEQFRASRIRKYAESVGNG